jgi:hypothetical protein
MRTFAKTLEYLLVTGVGLAIAYAFLQPVASGIADAMHHTSQMIEDPASLQ